MIGVLVKFLEFMKIEADKLNATTTNSNSNAHQPKESSQMIERDEKDNVFSEQSEIITQFENGKAVKIQVITQTIPVSKTTAMRKTIVERIK